MHSLTRTVSVLVVAAVALGCGTGWAQPQDAEKVAVKAAEAWLGLVDAEKYAESWDAAASLFRGAISKDDWVKLMVGNRRPLGRLVSRTFGASKYMTSLPGAPDGQYVVIQYKTVFENKAESIETITPMWDKDGAWRVSGYYIK